MSGKARHWSEDYAYSVGKLGSITGGTGVTGDALTRYGELVPESLVRIWREYGFGVCADGMFQLCNPGEYQWLLEAILTDDPDFPATESAVIGIGAFGKLMVWNNKNRVLYVDLVFGDANTNHFSKDLDLLDRSHDLLVALSYASEESGEFDFLARDKKGGYLFTVAAQKCGLLQYGECYGFFPAIGIGGRGILSEVRRVKAVEHLAILAQLTPLFLKYYDHTTHTMHKLRHLGPFTGVGRLAPPGFEQT
jgi:hypothetical protein